MPLYNVTFGDGRIITPTKIERSDTLKALRRELPKNTFERLVKTVDEAVSSVKPSKSSRLVWTKAGALFGHHSEQPKCWVDHLWEKVIAVVGDGRLCLITVGTLLLWRVSLRDEMWLVYNRDSGITDDVTGKMIRISEYWVNENYIPPEKRYSPRNLVSKFN